MRSFKGTAVVLFSCLMGLFTSAEIGIAGEQKNSGEAEIRFLGHCGFAVQTENHFLIFDYIEKRLQGQYEEPETLSLAAGYINPEEIKDRKVRVFVTHDHDDHHDPVIYGWQEAIPDIKYFFGWQASNDPKYNYLIGPRAEWSDDDIQIYTVNSYDSGVPVVAYLALVDGLAIYFNGDCKVNYSEDLAYLKSKTEHLDIAFMPPVWEEKWDYYRITLELISQLQPMALFPIHVRVGDEEKYFEPFKRTFQPKMSTGQVILTRNEKGAVYSYKNGITTGLD